MDFMIFGRHLLLTVIYFLIIVVIIIQNNHSTYKKKISSDPIKKTQINLRRGWTNKTKEEKNPQTP
jgi:hypothetical protein